MMTCEEVWRARLCVCIMVCVSCCDRVCACCACSVQVCLVAPGPRLCMYSYWLFWPDMPAVCTAAVILDQSSFLQDLVRRRELSRLWNSF